MSGEVAKVPHGYKRCPKCQGLVKGPRTKVCTNGKCGHEFISGKPAKAKAVVKVKVAEPTPEVKPAVIPDPYTFTVDSFPEIPPIKGAHISRRATGAILVRKAARLVLESLRDATLPINENIPNEVVYA